jgi:hypothetical protein
METKLIRVLVVLGVPGVALGIFYLLLKRFYFQFSQISAEWSAVIAILFLILVAAVTAYALHRWSPDRAIAPNTNKSGIDADGPGEVLLRKYGETITCKDLLRTASHDVVKLYAHSHELGVAAEYRWVSNKYPKSKIQEQALTSLELLTGDKGQIHFDRMTIKLPDGHTKVLFFDISTFFNAGSSSLIDPDSFIAGELRKLYRTKS